MDPVRAPLDVDETAMERARPNVVASAHPVRAFVIRRTIAGAITLLIASFLIFASLQVLPGDVAGIVLGRDATPEKIQALRADLSLDEPLLPRYAEWLGNVLAGDLGNSSVSIAIGSPNRVWTIISKPLLNTLVLALMTMILVVILAFGLGTFMAVRSDRWEDHLASSSALVVGAMPEFLIGILLILVFFTWLDVLPPISPIGDADTPFTDPSRLVLPCLTLLAFSLAPAVRMIRATTIDQLGKKYVTMARLNGYSERTILWRFAVRNALPGSIQTLALTIRYLIGGIIVTEALFSYPGIGTALVQAVTVRDIQTVSVIAMLLATIYVVVNVVADVAVHMLVPKLRTGS
jgi:peptide/nickel transport system permease protein